MPFVSFEGVDGSGKTTQVAALADWLTARGQTVVKTKEPGGGSLGAAVYNIFTAARSAPLSPVEELLLVNAARYDHVRSVIRPALAWGHWVLTDRFFDSTYALQIFETKAPEGLYSAVIPAVIEDTIPDLTFILDVDPELAARRRTDRATDDDPSEKTRNFERIRRGFLRVAAQDPGRCRVIDASLPPDEVAAFIQTYVQTQLVLAPPISRPVSNL